MKKFFIVILLFIYSSSIFADEISDDLLKLGFVEKNAQSKPSGKTFHVKMPLAIEEYKRNDSGEIIFDAGTVKYVGIDHGEFPGGGVYLNAFNENVEPLLEANIHAMVPVNDDLYIFTGYSHMGFTGGAIYVMRDYQYPSKPERVTFLTDSPEAVFVDQSDSDRTYIVIAGYESLIEYIPQIRLNDIVNNAFWRGKFPNSIVKYKKHYLLGVQNGIAVVYPKFMGTTERYFVPVN